MQKKKKGEKENNQKTNGRGKHGEKEGKTGGTTIELPTNTPIELPTNTPALSKKKKKARQKLNENNREKSKSRKVNRNSAGLCTNE